MAITYGKKHSKRHTIMYTIIVAVLLCAVFLTMVLFLYNKAEDEAYEALHVQTKQIKDDIILQLISDRENLETMASFAAKLYKDGDDYSLLFESFEPIGMIENIGILNADNTFATKAGVTDMSGTLSFDEESQKGVYISGRIEDVTNKGYELIRSAVPIEVNGKIIGILYGAVKPEKLGSRYKSKVDELGAQLFVYEETSGDLVIDTVHDELENISLLKDRNYNKGSSYEQLISTDKGFVSFRSAYKKEDLHLHYSTIEELNWVIAMGRYDSEVLAGAHLRAMVFTLVFLVILSVIVAYIIVLMTSEKRLSAVAECASNVRKELLETTDGHNNIQDALIEICTFAKSRSAIFFNTDGEFYHYIAPQYDEVMLSQQERQHFRAELFRYAAEFHHNNNQALNVMSIKADKHMLKTNPSYFHFLKEHGIWEVSLSATINKANHTTILAAINPKRGALVGMLFEKVSACFSMALHNKNYLNRTILAATTDSLTGALNRVAYKSDLLSFDQEKSRDFSCVYVDVNELHLVNNKYGHSAGDEMLVYIANTLKDVFYGHKVYRMGGDEFLVFCQNTKPEAVKKNLDIFQRQMEPRNYHVAIGMSYRTQNTGTEDMVREAEVRMYEVKAEYYQNKESAHHSSGTQEYLQIQTGILEIDTMLSVLKEKYNGIYRVSLTNDKARRILMPAYLNYNESEEHFSKLFSKYVAESVHPDYHRAVLNFLNYEALKHQLMDDKTPKISFKKTNGELVVLSVYKLCDTNEIVSDTLWVFAKE